MSLSLRLQEPFELLNSNAKCVNTVPTFNPSSLSHCLHHPRLVCQNLLNQLELWDRNKWCEGMKGRNVKVKVVKRIHFLLSCHYYCSSHSRIIYFFTLVRHSSITDETEDQDWANKSQPWLRVFCVHTESESISVAGVNSLSRVELVWGWARRVGGCELWLGELRSEKRRKWSQ